MYTATEFGIDIGTCPIWLTVEASNNKTSVYIIYCEQISENTTRILRPLQRRRHTCCSSKMLTLLHRCSDTFSIPNQVTRWKPRGIQRSFA